MYPGAFAATHPDKPAIIMADTGETLTYAELEDRSIRLAHVLHAASLRKGDSVALLSENSPLYHVAYWAALRSGLYLTAVNFHLSYDEQRYILGDCGARVLIASATLGERAAEFAGGRTWPDPDAGLRRWRGRAGRRRPGRGRHTRAGTRARFDRPRARPDRTCKVAAAAHRHPRAVATGECQRGLRPRACPRHHQLRRVAGGERARLRTPADRNVLLPGRSARRVASHPHRPGRRRHRTGREQWPTHGEAAEMNWTVNEMLEAARARLQRVDPHEAAAAAAAGALLVDTRPAWQRAEEGELPGC